MKSSNSKKWNFQFKNQKRNFLLCSSPKRSSSKIIFISDHGCIGQKDLCCSSLKGVTCDWLIDRLIDFRSIHPKDSYLPTNPTYVTFFVLTFHVLRDISNITQRFLVPRELLQILTQLVQLLGRSTIRTIPRRRKAVITGCRGRSKFWMFQRRWRRHLPY